MVLIMSMKRLKTIKYISETSVDEMVNYVVLNNSNLHQVISAAKESRTEYGLKVQDFIDRLSGLIGKLEVGMILETKQDCMNNFRKGQRVELTRKTENGFIVDGAVELEAVVILEYFKTISDQSE